MTPAVSELIVWPCVASESSTRRRRQTVSARSSSLVARNTRPRKRRSNWVVRGSVCDLFIRCHLSDAIRLRRARRSTDLDVSQLSAHLNTVSPVFSPVINPQIHLGDSRNHGGLAITVSTVSHTAWLKAVDGYEQFNLPSRTTNPHFSQFPLKGEAKIARGNAPGTPGHPYSKLCRSARNPVPNMPFARPFRA